MILNISCAVCGHGNLWITVIGDARRGTCPACQHEQRIDIERFDYAGFAMGGTGSNTDRLRSQADFVAKFLPPGASVLELGCATGQLAAALRDLVPVGHYHGIELSPAAAAAVQTLDGVFGDPLPSLLASGQIAPESRDFIISSHCLEHIERINDEIACSVKALRQGGRMFIEVPNRSGHPSLPFDDNRSHLHFFSVNSLSRLLSRHGLTIIALETGAWHDSRYPDCIRVVAGRGEPLQAPGRVLSDSPLLAIDDAVVVWGAGKMVPEMLAHFFDPAKILFFVDKDTRKHGTLCLGRPVRPPEALLGTPGCTVVINTIEFEDAVRAELAEDYGAITKAIVSISKLLGDSRAC